MTIVCATDFGPESERAGEVAASLALRFDEPLVLVHAISPGELPSSFEIDPGPGLEAIEAAAQGAISMESLRLAAMGARVTTRVELGAPDNVISLAAEQVRARLVVCGARGSKAPLRWIAGSTASRLARGAPAPLLVCHGSIEGLLAWGRAERPLRVLVAFDLDETFGTEMALADSFLDGGPCELEFVHAAGQDSAREREFAKLAAEERRVHLVTGPPEDEVPMLASAGKFDLLVVGTHARTGAGRLMRPSIAERILQTSPVPTAIARLGLAIGRTPPGPLPAQV